MSETIFAPLTIKGKCSIYVIRISGDKTVYCLKRLGIDNNLEHRKSTLCSIKDTDGSDLDEIIATYYRAPNSFTGENVCELNLHCSPYIINRVFKILSDIEGVRIAENGEFSKRAFLNGKFDLTKAESIVDLVNSESQLQHKQAIEQLKGKNFKFFENIRKQIIELAVSIESLIDFPEDETNIDTGLIKNKTNELICTLQKSIADNEAGRKIKEGLGVSIIGKPNVGKSSFFNFLAGREAAIVSDVAGTTRDILEASVEIGGIIVNFFDTAGIRETDNAVEQEGVRRAISNAKNADLRILMLSPEDLVIDEKMKNLAGENTLVVLNKIDLIDAKTFAAIQLKIPNIIGISIKNNTNTNLVLETIEKYIEETITPYMGTNITQERYRVELEKAINYLQDIDFSMPIEIAAEHIRAAGFCIGEITGQINTEEILDSIFSKFCIGK